MLTTSTISQFQTQAILKTKNRDYQILNIFNDAFFNSKTNYKT
ncbi:protein of unknown function [Streptococcus thermophilus]|nr:protein of unknown function [Streptococcus thermophilus]